MERRTINLKATKSVWDQLETVVEYNRIRKEGHATKQELVTAYIEKGLEIDYPGAKKALAGLRPK